MKINRYYKRIKFHIGKRIIKTTIAVYICLLIYQLRGQAGIPFYSAISAVLCMQPDAHNSEKFGLDRLFGTLVGAIYGIVILYIARTDIFQEWVLFIIMAISIIPIIQTSITFRKASAAAISSVVFLSVAASYDTDTAPLLVTIDRVIDTSIGVAVSLFVNNVRVPRYRRKNILFVLDIDHSIEHDKVKMSHYSKLELNRMILDGANVAVSTESSPAAIWEYLSSIQLKLPVIAMNGAVLYDLKECKYVRTYPISAQISQNIVKLLEDGQIGYFVHSIVHDAMLIYVSDFRHFCMQDKYRKLRRSPYRNYMYGKLPDGQDSVFFYILDQVNVIDRLVEVLKNAEYKEDIFIEDSMEHGYVGYKSLSIYSSTASKELCVQYLKNDTRLDKTMTIGSEKNKYDITLKDEDENIGVKLIKRMYESYFWEKRKDFKTK